MESSLHHHIHPTFNNNTSLPSFQGIEYRTNHSGNLHIPASQPQQSQSEVDCSQQHPREINAPPSIDTTGQMPKVRDCRELETEGCLDQVLEPVPEPEEETDVPVRLCDCGRPAMMKVVAAKSENRGLRYFGCEQFTFFGKKHKYCRFFEWIDTPRVTREQRRKDRSKKIQKPEVSQHWPTIRTRAAARHELEQDRVQFMYDSQREDQMIEATGGLLNVVTGKESGTGIAGTSKGTTEGTEAVSDKGFDELLETGGQNVEQKNDLQSILLPVAAEGVATAGPELQKNHFFYGEGSVRHGITAQKVELPVDESFESHVDESSEGLLKAPLCHCSEKTVLKTVKSKGPNLGLRYWICSNSRPRFQKKKKDQADAGEKGTCTFFKWIDTPILKSEEQKEERRRKKEHMQQRELALLE